MTMPSRAAFLGDLVTRLRADSAVAALLGARLFSHVPQPADGQRLTLPLAIIRLTDERADTKTDDGLIFTITVDAWDNKPTEQSVLAISDAITNSLHDAQQLLTDGYLTFMHYLRGVSTIESDGLSHHATLTFQAMVTKT